MKTYSEFLAGEFWKRLASINFHSLARPDLRRVSPFVARPTRRVSMTAGSRSIRKAVFVSAALATAVMSCGREPTGPGGDGVRYSHGIAFNTEFPQPYTQYRQALEQANQSAGDVAEFSRVRIVLRFPDGSIAKDTVIDFPAGVNEVPVPLNILLPASVTSSGVTLTGSLNYLNDAGQTIWSKENLQVPVTPATPGSPPPPPVVVVPTYVGPGATATGVRISPKTLTVNTGGAFSFSAVAVDASGNVVPGTPIVFSAENPALANVNAASGGGTAANTRGTTQIFARTLTNNFDAAVLTVVSPPSSIAAVSGSGQTANAGAQLTNPVVVQVNATDGQPAQGVTVTFAAQNGGTTGAATVVTGANGQASTTWRLGAASGAQTLTASAAGLTGSPVTFSATARAVDPVRLVFLQNPPVTANAGEILAPAITVQAVDASNALTTAFTGQVTIALGSGAPAGATLGGTTTVTAVAGVATFSTLTVSAPGSYTLVATNSSLTSATSNTFAISAGAANRLAFQNYPTAGLAAGATMDPITVVVRDALNNTVTAFNGPITLAPIGPSSSMTSDPVAAGTDSAANVVFSGAVTVSAVAGVATFSDLQLMRAGTYSLSASSTGLTGTTGPSFTVRAGAVTSLVLASGGGQSAAGGATLASPIVVRATDNFGNGIAGVTVTFTPVAGNGSVTPTSAVTSAAGTTQTTWTIGGAAGTQTLNVASTGLTPNPLVVNATATTTTVAGPATQLVFTQQPTNTPVGAPITPAIQLTAKDASGLVATTFTGSITIGILANPGDGSLSGTTTVAAVAGVATFPGLSVSQLGIGYTLQATSSLPTVASSAFNVTGGAIATTTLNTNLDSLYSFGETVTKVATSRDATTAVVAGSYTWVSRNTAVATVNGSGVITSVANGATYVVVTESGGTKDSTRVVVQQRVATINVTPGTRNIYKTRTFQFTAAAVDGRGNAMPATFVWTTLAPAIASTDANGLVTGVSLGGTQVRATANGITGVASVNILTPITRIIVGRDSSGVPVTDTTALPSLGVRRSMRAEARDTLDAPMAGVTFTWSSSNGSVALLDSLFPSRATALSNANGNTTIIATADGISGSAPLKVQQVLTSVELTPTPDTIGVTGTVQLIARGKDANSRYITGGSFTFASDNTPVATVNATTGVVTGQSLGTANVTATSGAITSNNAVIVVSTTVPPIISFGLDTLTVGRGASKSIPVFLSRANGTNVVVSLAARDTNAFFSVGSITFTPGQTSQNVTLNGRNAGTTQIYALETSGNGYKGDTAGVAVQANMAFNTGGWSLNATDQVNAQVLLSDPSPAGGTFVTFTYGTAGRAQISPEPAFIPAGQLASNIVITAMGSTNGSTTITPVATGVNGSPSTLNVYAPNLTFSATNVMVGAGQFIPDHYVYSQVTTNFAIPITFTSSDTSVATVTPSGTIPGGSYYVYFTMTGKAPGTARIIASAAGWRPDTIFMTVTSPRLSVTGQTSFNTTSPQTTMTVYAVDSVDNAHYRTSSLAISVSSSDTSVMKVIDQSSSIPAGQYYVNTVRYQPGGAGGTAWIKVTAGGHVADSMLVTVVGPKLQFSWCCTNLLGKGQYEPNVYVYTPNNVTSPLNVTLTSDAPAKATSEPSVTVPTGSYYAYFNVSALDTGLVRFIATAPGYQPDTAFFRVSSPRVGISGGGTRNAFSPPAGFTLYASDSTHPHAAHYRSTPLAISLRSTDTTVIKVDSASATIATGLYYHNTAHVLSVGTGSAWLVAEAAGHRPDSVLYTVVTPKIQFSWNTYLLGRRQFRASTDLYVHVPDNRTSPLAVTITQTNAAIDSLAATSLTIPNGLYYAYLQPHAKGGNGIDTLIVSAPGYSPDTAFIRVSSPRLYYGGGLPSNAATTNPPVTVTIYATDSTNNAHYAMDTLVIRAVSSDTTVIKPAQQYFRLIKGNYYVQPQIQYVGPGTASITYSDSAGTGYASTTTNTVTVTGPSLVFGGTTARYGMRQRGSATDYYIYTQNNVASPVTVTLTSSAPVVATVPATVTIPTGSYYAYFTITAQDTVGTIQITASAPGFGPPATPVTVTVTQPRFVISTNANPRTTSGPQGITIYATDDQGNAHYVTENVTMNLASSSGAVFTVDSSQVTIVSGNYYNNLARVTPVGVGSAQLSATDPRAAIYKYNTGTQAINVSTPNLSFSWNNVTIGRGQYIDQSYYCCFYIQTADNQAAPTTVTLGHAGAAKTSVPATVTIPTNLYYSYFRIDATSFGVDTLTASASSPFHNPDSAFVTIDSGTVVLSGWPANRAVGDSALVTLTTRDPGGGTNMLNIAATTFALSSNANIEFRVGGAVVTSVVVPANNSQVQFYVKAKSSGSGTATISNANYKTFSPAAIVIP
jgi:hypothetical protein